MGSTPAACRNRLLEPRRRRCGTPPANTPLHPRPNFPRANRRRRRQPLRRPEPTLRHPIPQRVHTAALGVRGPARRPPMPIGDGSPRQHLIRAPAQDTERGDRMAVLGRHRAQIGASALVGKPLGSRTERPLGVHVAGPSWTGAAATFGEMVRKGAEMRDHRLWDWPRPAGGSRDGREPYARQATGDSRQAGR
jgi:hypothetical protein